MHIYTCFKFGLEYRSARTYLCPVVTHDLGVAVGKCDIIPTQTTFELELIGNLSYRYNKHTCSEGVINRKTNTHTSSKHTTIVGSIEHRYIKNVRM